MEENKHNRASITAGWARLQKLWKRWEVPAAFIAIGAMALFGTFILMSPWLNTLDVQDWKCEAISATPHTSSGGLRGSASTASVIVETKNCGQIYIGGKAVNFSNQEAVASSFEPGSEWIFQLGWFTRNYTMRILGGPPTVYEYHRVH